jgi:hypothetical protein
MGKRTSKGIGRGPKKGAKGAMRPARKADGAAPTERPTRKNHYLYQSKINLAKQILGAETETETLDRALDLVIYAEALAVGTESMADQEYNDVLGIVGEIPRED